MLRKVKYMVMSRGQNDGEIQNIKIGNKSFQRVEQFRYLETTLKKITSAFRKKLKAD